MNRLGIVTGVYYKGSETQVNYHVENARDGNTCVLAAKQGQIPPVTNPHLIWTDESRVTDYLFALKNYRYNHSIRVPHGRQRSAIRTFINQHRIDIMLAEFASYAVYIAPIAEELGIPLFTMVRGADASSHLKKSHRVTAYHQLMPRLSGVISVSGFLLNKLAEHGIQHSNSHVIPSGVDTHLFFPTVKRPRSCLFVGRLIEKKRPDMVIDAFASVAKHYPDATLEIIGDGPLRQQCEHQISSLASSDRITVHGRQSHDFVRARMSECETYLQPSMTAANGDAEGAPTTIQEAMSCGMAVIATRHAGIPELVTHRENGLLAAEADTNTLTRYLGEALAHSGYTKRLGEQARQTATAKFDRKTLLTRLEHVIFQTPE